MRGESILERVDEILRFWFGDGDDPSHAARWFTHDPAFDETCRAGFLNDYERAAAGELNGWMETPRGALALIVLLDQLPRNMFRDTPRAFATDAQALAAAKHAIARGFDLALAPAQRAFIYMPLEHSESLDEQDESVRLFRQLAAEHPAQADWVGYAEHHRDAIRRFGRFPSRNAVLGRASTAEEAEFLRRST